jgi:predicted phosphodiesterase
MTRIFITGDTHRNIDTKKLNTANFPEQKNLTKQDYLIICGDFGMVWDNSEEEVLLRKWLDKKNFTTLFVDGNHENFDLLKKCPVRQWKGGRVSYISKSIIHLKRGQIFNINGHTLFTMGGASSIDKYLRTEGKTWWKEELPSVDEINEAIDNLEKYNWSVDYVITHTTSRNILRRMGFTQENNILNSFFNMLEEDLSFKHWYFGHFHGDKNFGKRTLVYNKIIEL